MSTEIALATPASIDPKTFFRADQMELIKRQIAKGVTADEFNLFLYQCARTGLDPFSRQIYALERREKNDNGQWVSKMSIQTGIDGLRLIADRTGRYAPGPDNDYEYDVAGNLRKATAHVKKRTADGTWHTVSVSAFYAEYVQAKGNGEPNRMWKEKPHVMLGKCAEALALRKAFPAEMSGIYTSEEMGQMEQAPTYEPPPTQEANHPTLTVVPKAETETRGASGGSETSAHGTTNGQTEDTGEAPSESDLDDLEHLAFKELKLKKPYFRNWALKYFGSLPDAWTKVLLTDAMSALIAMGMGPEKYKAKLAELFAAGRVKAGPEES